MARSTASSAPPKLKTKSSFLEILGIRSKAVATPEQEQEANTEQVCIDGYWYLRRMIDREIKGFYSTGDMSKLRQFLSKPAFEALALQLEGLRQKRTVWIQPERSKRKPQLRLIPAGTVLNSKGQPSQFVIEEKFIDHSEHHRYNAQNEVDHVGQCPGRERVMRATVEVRNGMEYRLLGVTILTQ